MRAGFQNLLTISCILFASTNATQAATFTVDTTTNNASLTACTASAGDCSFAGALARANTDAALDTINFVIPNNGTDAGCNAAVQACYLDITASPALSITQPLIIDGSTQAGHTPNTLLATQGGINAQWSIEMGTSTTAFGLRLVADTTVRHVKFVNNSMALQASPGNGKTMIIEGCAFGGSRLGKAANRSTFRFDNSVAGTSTDTLRFGGLLAAQRNWIQDNYLLLGEFSTAVNAVMQGNVVGLIQDGSAFPLGVGFVDEREFFADARHVNSNILIGGSDPNARNLIAGGLYLSGKVNDYEAPHRLTLHGNWINIGSNGEALDPGFRSDLEGGVNVGGDGVGEGNRIRGGLFNLGNRNRIRGNTFEGSRSRLGYMGRPINVFGAGGSVELNDANDADATVQFRQQNYPVIKSVVNNAGTLNITYAVDSAPANTSYPLEIEFYLGNTDDGEIILGRNSYLQSEAQTDKTVSFPIPSGFVMGATSLVMATATTTETSPETSAMSMFPVTTQIIGGGTPQFPNTGAFPVRAQVTVNATYPSFAYGIVRFNATGAGQAGTECNAQLMPTATPTIAEATCLMPAAAGPLTLGQIRTVAAVFNQARNGFTSIPIADDYARGPFTGNAGAASLSSSVGFTVIGDKIFCNGFEDDPLSGCPQP